MLDGRVCLWEEFLEAASLFEMDAKVPVHHVLHQIFLRILHWSKKWKREIKRRKFSFCFGNCVTESWIKNFKNHFFYIVLYLNAFITDFVTDAWWIHGYFLSNHDFSWKIFFYIQMNIERFLWSPEHCRFCI